MVQHQSSRYFEMDPVRALLQQEWNAVREGTARIPSGPALSLSPAEAGREGGFRSHPDLIRLHLADSGVEGDLRCRPDALPVESESIQLLVARHVLDLLEPDSGIVDELARVLAPGGSLFLFGMNALSPWRLWSAIHGRAADSRPRIRSLARIHGLCVGVGLHPVRRGFLGGTWPGRAGEAGAWKGGRLDGAWGLVLAKQRSAVRNLPQRRRSNAMALGPGLARMPSRRACL